MRRNQWKLAIVATAAEREMKKVLFHKPDLSEEKRSQHEIYFNILLQIAAQFGLLFKTSVNFVGGTCTVMAF